METLPQPAGALLDRSFGERWRSGSLTRVQGTTNLVMRLTLGGEHFAIRIPRLSDMDLRVDRVSECAVVRAVHSAGLAPEVIACEADSGILITRWIQTPVWRPAQTASPSRLRAIAALLRRLHELTPPPQVHTLDLKGNLRSYWSSLTAQLPVLAQDLTSLNDKSNALVQHRTVYAPVLCHNDLNCRNIIGGAEVRLLDWEYSGLGAALFDLASYSQNHDLDKEARQLLLEAYGAPSDAREQFAIECQLFDWTCILWMALAGSATNAATRPRFELLLSRLRHAWT